MEFNISLKNQQPDLAVMESALLAIDPAAVIDLDTQAGKVRLSTCATPAELIAVMEKSGHAIGPVDIELVPSVCCGGCGG